MLNSYFLLFICLSIMMPILSAYELMAWFLMSLVVNLKASNLNLSANSAPSFIF